MHFLNTLAVLFVAAATSSTLAVPTDTRCAYESDNVHVTCLGANENYPRGVDVTYNLGARSEAEIFLRRDDAAETLKRGMDAQRKEARGDKPVQANPTGDLAKATVTFANGTSISVSDVIKHHPKRDAVSSTVIDGGDDHSTSSTTINGKKVESHADDGHKNKPKKDDKKNADKNGNVAFHVAHLGNGCTVTNATHFECKAHNVARMVMARSQSYGDNGGGGNAQGNICSFGSGSVNINRRGGGASVSCEQLGSPTYAKRDQSYGDNAGGGNSQGNVCNFGNGNINVKRGGSVDCTQSGSPTYGPSAGTTIVGANNLRRADKRDDGVECVYGNEGYTSKRDGMYRRCDQTQSPLYGPNGGQTTIIAPSVKRSFDMANVDDVVAYHNEIRAMLPESNENFRRDQEVCSGVPVGPVGPQATYVTKRSMPLEVETDIPQIIPSRIRPTPLAAQKVTPVRRCINTPIAPVGPSVTYESKEQYKNGGN